MKFDFFDKKIILPLLFLFSTASYSLDFNDYFSRHSSKNKLPLIAELNKNDKFTIKTVVVTGTGLTIENAIQDASVNALKLGIGSLIEAETK